MAIVALIPTGIASSAGAWTGLTSAAISTSDDVRASAGVGGVVTAEITDAPADYGSTNTVTLRVEWSISAASSRTKFLLVELLSAGTVLASFTTPALSASAADVTHASAAATVAAQTAAQVTAWQVRVTVQEGGGKGDTAQARIDRVWLDLDYAAAGPANTPPATPSIISISATSTEATLTSSAFSDPDAGATHAASQWQVEEETFSTLVIDTGDSASLTSYAASGLTPGVSYLARVRHKDNAGAYSAWSTDKPFSTFAAETVPAAPSGAAATSVAQPVVSWVDNATNETGYYVHRSESTGYTPAVGTRLSADLGANANAYTDASAAASKVYFYIVEAWNAAGSSYSAQASATTPAGAGATLGGKPVKRWNGTAWVDPVIQRWNGTALVPVT